MRLLTGCSVVRSIRGDKLCYYSRELSLCSRLAVPQTIFENPIFASELSTVFKKVVPPIF